MILNEFFNLPQVFEKDMEKDTQVNGQDVDVNVVVEKLQQIAAHAKQQIQNADYDQQVRYATTVRDRALQALDMIAQGGNTPEAARSAFAFMQTGKQGVAEAKDDYVPPKEADYGYEYQQMVRRVGQKAKQQEKAKQQQPKAPVRESRLALLKQIIQS